MDLLADIFQKLEILADAAKYDVACTSSGSSRKGKKGMMGNAVAGGICHCFAADGRCISLLKILQTNECVYDCKYCQNRCSNDIPRASFTPEEIAELTISFYRRNYIEGLFLSSGIQKNPDYTMEQMYQSVYLLRKKYKFNGYIHVKAIPGADPLLIEKTGWLVDRMSANLELPTADGLKMLAPQKSRKKILTPLRQIQVGRQENALMLSDGRKSAMTALPDKMRKDFALQEVKKGSTFVPAGQSTQMIIGATGESDYTLLQTTQQLYQGFDLKRVFYSAYIPLNEDDALPGLGTPTPLLREHRLYQADWLLRFYGFQAGELLSEEKPDFNELIDPKCDWALRHLEQFPVEIETASYARLLRVPGIGPKSASRITHARRYGRLDFASLKKMGVVLKRAHYFITCGGKQMYHTPVEASYIMRQLVSVDKKDVWNIEHSNESYVQLSLADFGIG